MRIHFIKLTILLGLLISACSISSSSITPDTEKLPEDTVTNSTGGQAYASFEQSPTTPRPNVTLGNPTPTPSQAFTPHCPAPDGYSWSQYFASDTSFINKILPCNDGNFFLSGILDDHNGPWLAKMDSEGKLIWQNGYSGGLAELNQAANGNLLLEFGLTNLEIDPEGNILRGVDIPWYQPNADGSNTIGGSGQAMRYTDPQKPCMG